MKHLLQWALIWLSVVTGVSLGIKQYCLVYIKMRESELKKKWSTLFTICPTKKHNNKKERLLTSTRKHAQAVFHLFGQVTDVRHFKIPDILWNLQPLFYKWVCLQSTPVAERIAGYIQTACSLFKRRFACVHVRVCTCVFAQECGFVLYPPTVAFLWGIFPDSFPYCDEEKKA